MVPGGEEERMQWGLATRAGSARSREEIFLISFVLGAGSPEEKALDPPLPHVQIHPDLVLQHPAENRIHVMEILQEFAQESPGLFRLELVVGKAGHVAENGLLGSGNDQAVFLGGHVNLGPPARSPVLLDGAKAHDLVGAPVLPVTKMDHPALFDLQCSLQP